MASEKRGIDGFVPMGQRLFGKRETQPEARISTRDHKVSLAVAKQ